MSTKKIIALALIALGFAMLYYGYQSSQGLDDRISEAVTGNFTDQTIAWLVAGAASMIVGIAMFRRR